MENLLEHHVYQEHDKNECIKKVFDLMMKPVDGRIDFRPRTDILKAKECPVCRTLAHLLQQIENTQDPVTHFSDGTKMHCGLLPPLHPMTMADIHGPEVQNIEVRLYRSHDPGPSNVHYNDHDVQPCSYDFRFEKGRKEISKADPSECRFKRRNETNDGSVDPEFLSQWITAFKKAHLPKCNMQTVQPLNQHIDGLKMIDVIEKRVIDAPPDPKHMALSYVWGPPQSWLKLWGDNANTLRSINGLSQLHKEIPQTVQDAMELVRDLGFRYLWMDSLCIIQDNPKHCMNQIASMGTIYECAQLVIVAAHGEDANAGIPGVKGGQFPLRCVMRREYIHPKARLLSTQPLPEALANVRWSTRGWTLQESVLARLKLTFTSTQAFVECRCGTFSSEDHALGAFHFGTPSDLIDNEKQCDAQNVEKCLLTEYAGFLAAYTARNLSNPGDILNAFTAFMSMLGRKWNTEFLYGLPVRAFRPALLWCSWIGLNKIKRRQSTILTEVKGTIRDCYPPSKSWAGWEGKMELENDTHWGSISCEQHTHKLDAAFNFPLSHVQLQELDMAMHIVLELEAWTAFFDIGKRQTKEEVRTYTHEPAHSIIHRQSEEVVSLILIPDCPYYPIKDEAQTCELIAITARQRPEFERGREWIRFYDDSIRGIPQSAPEIVDVMLISRHSQSNVAFRVGIAGILMDDWLAAEPVRKKIMLA